MPNAKKKCKMRNKTLSLNEGLEQERIQTFRNPFFNHPLMKKSHRHDKSFKAKRRAEKVKLNKDCYSQKGIRLINDFLRITVLNFDANY